MKLLLFPLLFILTFTTSAQVRFTKNLHSSILSFYEKIRSLGSDTIIVYEQYCMGCEVLMPSVYEGFLTGKIYWQLKGRYYSREIASVVDEKLADVEISGEIFHYFFSNFNHFKSKEKYKFDGQFLFPLLDHTSYQELNIYTPTIIHQVLLAEEQKDSTDWQAYEWIPPTIEIMNIVDKTFPHID